MDQITHLQKSLVQDIAQSDMVLGLMSNFKPEVEEAFQAVYEYFDTQITRTIKIPKVLKLQVFSENNCLIACSYERLYSINLEDKTQKLVEFDCEILSISLSDDKTFVVVILKSNQMEIYSAPGLDYYKKYPVEGIHSISSMRNNEFIGHGPEKLMRWKWVDGDLEEIRSITLEENQKVIYENDYYLLLRSNSWSLFNFDQELVYEKECSLEAKLATISHSGSFVAIVEAGDSEGTLKIYNTNDGSEKGTIQLSANYINDLMIIKFTPTENEILGGYSYGAFCILSLKQVNRKLGIAQKNTSICYMTIDPLNQYIYSSGKKNIYITPIPKRVKKIFNFNDQIFNVHEKVGCNSLFFIKKRSEVHFLCEISLFTLQEKEFPLPSTLEVLKVAYYQVSKTYFIAYKEDSFFKIASFKEETGDFNLNVILEIKREVKFEMFVSPDDMYLIVYDGGSLQAYCPDSLHLLQEIITYSRLNAIEYLEDQRSVVFDYSKKSIRFWNMKEDSVVSVKTPHSSPVTSFAGSLKFMYSGDSEGKIGYWNLREKSFLMFIGNHSAPISAMYMTKNYLYTFDVNSLLMCWETKTKVITVKSQGREADSLLITRNKNWFVHSSSYNIEINENLALREKISVAGVSETTRFMKYIKKLYPNETPLPFEESFESAVIYPYYLTPMHFYAYLNHANYLRMSLEAGSTLSNSSFNENPLSLAAMQNFKDSISIIIKHICNNYDLETNPYLLRVINNNSIINLNQVEIPNIAQLYNLFVRKSANDKLPKFVSTSADTPVYVLSEEVSPKTEKFKFGQIGKNKGKEVSFFESLVKLDIIIGSTGSNDFLQSLIETPNKEILTSKYVEMILGYKWQRLKKFILLEAGLYYFYLLLVLAYMIWFIDSKGPVSPEIFMIFPFFVNMILISLECFQFYANWREYLFNFRNVIDIVRNTFFVLYCLYIWIGHETEHNYILALTLVFISFLRGISYFRAFRQTRYLINVIREVAVDCIPFLILFIYTTIASGFLLYAIGMDNNEEKSLAMALGESYVLNLGDFSTEEYGPIEWAVFVFATAINPILMLNLLISIMGDTYGRVKETKEIADNIELAEIILEIESLFFFNKNKKVPKYYQMCTDSRFEEKPSLEDLIDEVRTELKDDMKDLRNYVNNGFDEIKSILQEIRQNQSS